MTDHPAENAAPVPSDFIRDIVAGHVAEKRFKRIVTRFPPEPNGYLHIGHAKSICLNFGIARENAGICNLRFDDTNPVKEDIEFVDSITKDVHWLIDGWADHCIGPKTYFASDYFGRLYDYALDLIRKGMAYVCDLSPEDTDKYRGAPDKPGKDSPWRNRSVAENLDLFQRMKKGEFPDATRTLRAKIDMAAPNVWLRDPLLYRIRHIAHHHAGSEWCIYPLYDYAHCLSDYIEGITHSVCTLEFEVHRPLYDWILASLELPSPRPSQYEFAKLIPSYTLVSKRKLLTLVDQKVVDGWDDPRMATLSGLRRRGIPASALRRFVIGVGVTKYNSVTDIALFEHAVRDELNQAATRRLAVLKPIKLVLTNIPADAPVACKAVDNPQAESPSTRPLSLTREVFIESDDFAEAPPPKFFRLKPGGEVRLKYACIVKCDEVVKDASGRIVELRGTADLTTVAGGPNVERKVKGTIHWVSATDSVAAEIRLYDRLFTVPEPAAEEDFLKVVNPNSLEIVKARLEPSLGTARLEDRFQFERLGYFALDPKYSNAGKLVFNRTISLRDSR